MRDPPLTSTVINIRPGRSEDCESVVRMVHELAAATGSGVIPRVSADGLRRILFDPAPLLRLLIADSSAGPCGYCLSQLLYSTWRGARGLQVIDLYLAPQVRGAGLGKRLIATAAAAGIADGAEFIRLEVERSNGAAEKFYGELGFHLKDNERTYVINLTGMQELAARA